jgi:hypothetical protein
MMTSKRISDQINTIRAATKKASVSSEAALTFLRSAGIIPEADDPKIAYGPKFIAKMAEGEEDIKSGNTVKVTLDDLWK